MFHQLPALVIANNVSSYWYESKGTRIPIIMVLYASKMQRWHYMLNCFPLTLQLHSWCTVNKHTSKHTNTTTQGQDSLLPHTQQEVSRMYCCSVNLTRGIALWSILQYHGWNENAKERTASLCAYNKAASGTGHTECEVHPLKLNCHYPIKHKEAQMCHSMEWVVDSRPGTVGATGPQVKGEDGGKNPEQDVCMSIIVKL